MREKILATLTVLTLFSLQNSCNGLDNGLALTPPMGYNCWYDIGLNINEDHIRATALAMVEKGFLSAGYRYVNLDDFWAGNRTASGRITADTSKFPSGSLLPLAQYVHSLGLRFGMYTDRGTETCGNRPGSYGYEALDAQTYAEWEIDYVKEDSCWATNDHQGAFEEYARMRDALNATGRPIYFSLCGWARWYAPSGTHLGNSWRIAGDDVGWGAVLESINANVGLEEYAGPGGWNDPDLLESQNNEGGFFLSELQSRFQFNFWCIMSAPLLISGSIINMTAYNLETYLNQEVIAINQDPLGKQGIRVWGDPFPKDSSQAQLAPCNASSQGVDPYQQWEYNTLGQGYLYNNATRICLNVDDCGEQIIYFYCVTSGGSCCGAECYDNERFIFHSNGSVTNPLNNTCLQSVEHGQVVLSPCNNTSVPDKQYWTYNLTYGVVRHGRGNSSDDDDWCLSTANIGSLAGLNIWTKQLAEPGTYALLFANAGPDNATLTCDETCFASMGYTVGQALVARDLWAHTNTSITASSFSVDVPSDGGSFMFKLMPEA